MASWEMIDGKKVLRFRTKIPGIHNLQDLSEKPSESKSEGKATKASSKTTKGKGE